MIYVHPGAEPFFLAGSKENALLFLHGFTASPSEVLPVARILHNKGGLTVSGILLPGHGSHPRFLNRTTWHDWYRAAEEEAAYLLAYYGNVYIAGLSMGGLLALHAGICLKGIKGVIAVNTPIYNHYPFLTLLSPLIQLINPYFPKKQDDKVKELKARGRFAYDCNPVKAFRSMQDLRNLVVKELREIEVPVLAMQSVQDEAVKEESLAFITKTPRKARTQGIKLYNSGHIATMEEPEIIAEEILKFINDPA